MDATQVREHWERRWGDHTHDEMGWFQAEREPSLGLVTSHTPLGGGCWTWAAVPPCSPCGSWVGAFAG